MAIKDLSLAARRTIDGFMTGINKSKVRGPGLEFSQYRSYQPGDDLRWLDWKRYARTDRYYIRESEIETSISVRLLVDASRSMLHRDGDFSKIDYARHLAAALGWLAHGQGDALGLYVFQEGEVYSLPARKDAQHLARFFHQLEAIEPKGRLGDPITYKHIFLGEQKRELLIFITDLYEQNDEISRMLELLASLRHEIIVFHVMGRNELEMNYGVYDQVEDLETGQRAAVSREQADAYQERMQAWLSAVRLRLLDLQISYQLMRMDQPMDQALRDFLKLRQ
ncbi:MAG: DUF58 domain-containing protein [Bacteroidetes bacterium]|nr:DUF58 domain-containing protein [Bacteroidota bacterium]